MKYEKLLERFIRYVKFETRSDETSQTIPSTQSQVEFAKLLMDELIHLGMEQIDYNTDNGFVTATLPASAGKEQLPVIGFIAHMDTADFNAENVQPQIVENYDGKAIILNADENIVLTPEDFPNLKNYHGKTLITTDGTTLLGSDDKSGIAEIMTAMDYLLTHPDSKHGKIRIAFGPDEEIGVGADLFDVDHFAADFAYTLDGGPVGELEYESFNAASARVRFKGKNVHPGTAKDTMVNANKLALEFDKQLPQNEVPEKTDNREGFFHLIDMKGTVEEAYLNYIIRDHDKELFQRRKNLFYEIAEKINANFDEKRVEVMLKDQYYNMREIIEKDMRPVTLAQTAMEKLSITPDIKPIRGGTDGSKISFMGLPTPNLFAGGENFHGRYEFVALESMEEATNLIIEIATSATEVN